MGIVGAFLFGLAILWVGLHWHLRREQVRVRVENDERD
jgi:hypothetical protein